MGSYEEKSDYNYLFCQNIVENLIIFLLRKTTELLGIIPDTQNQKQLFFSVKQIQEYIDKNFENKLSVDSLAQSACLSIGHFIKLFKSLTGQTPMQYILEQRLNAAKESLTYTDKSIKSICYEIGFSDINNFIKKFKEKTGQTPNDFRTRSAAHQSERKT